MLAHPGKKLLFMGQDFAQYDEWAEDRSLEWELLQYDEHKQMQNYVKALNTFYKEHPALYEMDYDPDGFTWINNISANENMVVFTRNTKKKEERDIDVILSEWFSDYYMQKRLRISAKPF